MDSAPSKALVDPYIRPMMPIPTSMQPTGALCPPIRCLLCDVYGTLFISGSGDLSIAKRESQSLNHIARLLDKYGLAIQPEKLLDHLYAAIDHYHQKRKEEGIAYPEVKIEKIWKDLTKMDDDDRLMHFAIEFEMVVNPFWPMPNLAELLETCRLNRIRLGIISNAQFYTPYLFEWFLGHRMIDLGFDKDLILFSYAFNEAKPSALLFNTACQRLEKSGISPQQTAYIGNDMSKDILPSKKAGFQTILFAGDSRSLRLDKKHPVHGASDLSVMPDLVVTDLHQLIKYLS